MHPNFPYYGWLMLGGIVISLVYWSRLARRDERLVLIYVGALVGAFLGAKIVYLASEGWLHWHDPNRWIVLATGKSITGALLGGYLGVEIAKKLLRFIQPTGDWFAIIAPLGIMMGRIGCFLNGCCLGRVCEPSWFTLKDVTGVARWPAVPMEFLFNAMMLGAILLLRRRKMLLGQHFHIYLMAYGIFRFFHEFLRDTPEIVARFSGYQIAALAIVSLGVVGFVRRRKQMAASRQQNGQDSALLAHQEVSQNQA